MGIRKNTIKIKTALISLSDKSNLRPLLNLLKKYKIKIISSGGTYKKIQSMGFKCLEISKNRYHVDSWNTYVFHCSDGDNWSEDLEKTIELSERLKSVSQLYCYCEIEPDVDRIKWLGDESRLSSIYQHLCDKNFKIVKINQPEDIWPAFKYLFGGNLGV